MVQLGDQLSVVYIRESNQVHVGRGKLVHGEGSGMVTKKMRKLPLAVFVTALFAQHSASSAAPEGAAQGAQVAEQLAVSAAASEDRDALLTKLVADWNELRNQASHEALPRLFHPDDRAAAEAYYANHQPAIVRIRVLGIQPGTDDRVNIRVERSWGGNRPGRVVNTLQASEFSGQWFLRMPGGALQLPQNLARSAARPQPANVQVALAAPAADTPQVEGSLAEAPKAEAPAVVVEIKPQPAPVPESVPASAAASAPAAEPPSTPAPTLAQASAPQPVPAPTTASAPAPVATAAQTLLSRPVTLQEFIARLRSDNRNIQGKRAERDLAETGIGRANAAFQPTLNISALNSYSNQRNTLEEELTRAGLDNYERKGQDYTAAVSQLLSSGTKMELKSSLSRFMTNINRSQGGILGDDYYNRSTYGLAVTQPLLKDAGSDATTAKRRVAELDTRAAEHSQREVEISTVAEAAMSYYDLVFAQERVQVAGERVEMGMRLLDQAKTLVNAGRLPQSDIWEVENSLGRYRAALSEARQIELDRSNKLRNFITIGPEETALPRLQAADRLPDDIPAARSFGESMREARANRADLQMRQAMVERENVQYEFSLNQKKPKLDLVANYGRTGLALNGRESFLASNTREFPNWTVGLQFSAPIGTNLQGQADVQAAAIRRNDAVLALRALEVAIGNDIETSLGLRESAAERHKLLHEVAVREQRHLELERRRLEMGRSDMREILVREERAINARLAASEQRLVVVKSDVMLQAAQGVLLNRFR